MADRRCKRQQPLVLSRGGVLQRPRIDSDDILIEILSRLPVKSLIRSRCVCKSWRALISDSHLVRKQLRNAVIGIVPNSLRFLISTNRFHSIDYQDLKGDPVYITSRELFLPIHHMKMRIVGSCNGLICLVGDSNFVILWNPCTRDINMLPGLTSFPWTPMFYGFGYASTVEDYKVILGARCEVEWGLYTTCIAVFSLKAGSWRTVLGLHYANLSGQGCLLNGALHWLEHKWAQEDVLRPTISSRIISFDLAEEKFQEMVPLSHISNQKYISVRVGTIRNSLFVYFFDHSKIAVTIWMMMEYGVKESWAKVLEIPLEPFRELGYFNIFDPIYILESGKFLMSYGLSDLVLYNPKEKKMSFVLLEAAGILSHESEAAMYIESLVSPLTGSGAGI